VAIAKMDALSKEHGPSMTARLIVPLVSAFFIDLVDAVMMQIFLRFPLFQ
jgi:ESS family glutamate:Na+ symporter